MSASDLFPIGSATAYQEYVFRLENAVKRRDWIYDPAFELGTDAEVYEKVRRDPVAEHAMAFRRHMTAGSDWHIEPASDREEDQSAASIIDELIESMHGFTDSRVLLAESVFRGSAWAFIQGSRTMRRAGEHFGAWWAPERLKDIDRRRFRQVSADAEGPRRWEMRSVVRERWERIHDLSWFVSTVHGQAEDTLGYGRGLFGVLYLYQAAKSRVLQNALSASERFGEGLVVAKIDGMRQDDGKPTGSDGETIADQWLTALRNMVARNGLVFDARDEVELLTGMGEGFAALMQLIEYFDAAQTMAVLGATVPTMSPDGGSFALAREQSNSTAQLVRADRERLGEDLTRDLVGLIWRQNQGQLRDAGLSAARMPRLILDHEKREDPQAAATVIATLLAAGVDLKAEEVYEKVGFTAPGEGDERITAAVPAEDVAPVIGDTVMPEVAQQATPEDVSASAMNGAQITALKDIIQSVSENELPPGAALELILSGFPSIDRDTAQRMIDSANSFDPPAVMAAP